MMGTKPRWLVLVLRCRFRLSGNWPMEFAGRAMGRMEKEKVDKSIIWGPV